MKWSELKKQGVRRCPMYYTQNGRRCRRRALEGKPTCGKHARAYQRVALMNADILCTLKREG